MTSDMTSSPRNDVKFWAKFSNVLNFLKCFNTLKYVDDSCQKLRNRV